MCCGKAFVNPIVAVAILLTICQLFQVQHEVAADDGPVHNRSVFINTTIPKSIFDIRNPIPLVNHKCDPGKTYIVTYDKKRVDIDFLIPFKDEPELIGGLAPCSVCICSWDGMTEDCLDRTGNGTNECLKMAVVAKNKHLLRPHTQWNSLFNRIRKEDMICCNHDATRTKHIHDKIKLRVKKELDLNAVKVEDLLKQEPEIKKHKRFSGDNDYVDFIVNNDK